MSRFGFSLNLKFGFVKQLLLLQPLAREWPSIKLGQIKIKCNPSFPGEQIGLCCEVTH